MRLSTYTLVALVCAVFGGLMASQADAALVFTGQEDPQIQDDFEDGSGLLNTTTADHGSNAPIQWVADNDFELAVTDRGGVVRRGLGGPGDSVAYLPYIYNPEMSHDKRATIAMDVFLGTGTDAASLAFVNQSGDNFLGLANGSSNDSGSGELWMELYRLDSNNNAAAVRILKRKPLDGGGEMVVQVHDSAGLAEFDLTDPLTMELSWQYPHGHGDHLHDAAIAARVNGTDVFTGDDLPENAHEVESVWHLQGHVADWEPSIEGYGFAFDGAGGEILGFEAVPEPSSIVMMAMAGLVCGLVNFRRRG